MKKINITILLFAVILIVVGISMFVIIRMDNQETKKKQVYLVVKAMGENTDFWSNVINGAEVAAKELGVHVIIKGTDKEIMIDEQINIMYEIIKERPEAIAIAANDYFDLNEVCEKAVEQGITLVTVDSDVNMSTEHSFVATNNKEAAKIIGNELASLMNETGEVAIVSHVKGVFTAFEREEGFKKGLQDFENIHILEKIYYANNSQKTAYKSVINIVETYPDLTAVFATNEVTLLGVARAIKDLGLEEEIIVVGFDMNREIATMIEEEIIDGTMVQKPFNMGYTAIKEALEVLEGKEVEKVDTGVVLINRNNMFSPENQKLIVPIID